MVTKVTLMAAMDKAAVSGPKMKGVVERRGEPKWKRGSISYAEKVAR